MVIASDACILDYVQACIKYLDVHFCIFLIYKSYFSSSLLFSTYLRPLEVPRRIKLVSPILMDLILSWTTWNSLERSTALWLATGKTWRWLRVSESRSEFLPAGTLGYYSYRRGRQGGVYVTDFSISLTRISHMVHVCSQSFDQTNKS